MADDPRVTLVLAVADDELILGHRHSEWTGWAPHIEEDLAFSSIAQDEIAHARLLYELAAETLGGETDADRLALGREPGEYRHAVICERPNADWGYTVARHFLYDTADARRLDALARSSWKDLADRAKLMQLEERYHLEHARTWFGRLADGPVEARQHLADGLAGAVAEAMAIFEPLPDEATLVGEGVLPRSNEELLADWLDDLGRVLEEAALDWVLAERAEETGEFVPTAAGEVEAGPTIRVPGLAHREGRWVHEGDFAGEGGRVGRHTDDFAALWQEMTSLYRAHPGARW